MEQQTTAPRPLRIEPLPAEHAGLCGLGPDGALLIRPDGHIAARRPDAPAGGSDLQHTLTTITRSTTP
ncbi:hypothetical protein [Streptomyces sp. GESEQ-35]|uniref:aromatic-ring hydroxylase C-terminal domain-containing protein n=1 Tax=Streptomyces sp. GESEQ-35 TaxID=2812657 RepID=UPI0035AB7AE9